MANELISAGDVLIVKLSTQIPQGFEQEGKRPVIVVGVPSFRQRFPVIIVVPLTTRFGNWTKQNPNLYPYLAAGSGGLTTTSWILLDQIRSLDLRRIVSYIGTLQMSEYQKIKSALAEMLNLEKTITRSEQK